MFDLETKRPKMGVNLLMLLHERYWGKGEEGWRAIVKRGRTIVSHLDKTSPASTGTKVDYEYIDLGPDFENFFVGNNIILIRQEYLEILDYITKLLSNKPLDHKK
jgi:hypothetical protein